MNSKIDTMLEANKITHQILDSCRKLILNSEKPIETSEVEKYVRFCLNRLGLKSAFKGLYGFPGLLCISLNDEIIHGLPKEDVKIKKGDVVSLDFGVKLEGYCADAAITFLNQKKISPINKKQKLINDTKKALEDSVEALKKSYPNCHVSDVTTVIDAYKEKYGIVSNFYGHEVGKNLHEGDLKIPNTVDSMTDDRLLKIGKVITIEPMFTLGSGDNYLDEDGYTIKTKDGSIAAHFEYSIAIDNNDIKVLK